MPAFLQAIEDQADYIELDVRETKDEKIVVIHDATLKRLAGVNKRVENLTYKELLKYDLGSHFSKEYKHLRIQTLDEVIKELRGKAKLHIEVKATGNEKNIEESIVKIIKKNHFVKDCIIASNNYDILVKTKKLEPRIQTV